MDLQKYIEANRGPAIETLKELIRIRSDRSSAVEGEDSQIYPFGEGVQRAFEYMLAKGEEMGFSVENIDNYGGHIDFGGGEETVGVMGHLDVVPAGDGWDSDPYGAEEEDGYIIGRGTTDDKGPVIASLYAKIGRAHV